MALIGQVLTAPEAGWKRYDDTNILIEKNGWSTSSPSGFYNNTASECNDPSKPLKFSFIGSKLRIIGKSNSVIGDATITIDGHDYIYSGKNQTNDVNQCVVFEILDLNYQIHKINIVAASTAWIDLDAIDIDSSGRLVHPDEVTDIRDLDVGKRIRCHYSASSNTVGAFSGLGQETSDFIPAASSATPNGDFYFIMVVNWNKKKILIADRNIQNSISWDVLNTAGIASGSGIPIGLQKNSKTVVRLMTGGIAAIDKDDEWDKYIVSSTLNGTITAGDNNVWNWNGVLSWTSTTSSSNRVERGNSSVSYWVADATSTVSVNRGFRPVLEIEILPQVKSFLRINGEYRKWDVGVPEVPEGTVDIVQKMTSYSSNGVSISSDKNSIADGSPAWQAFDDVNSSVAGSNPGWQTGSRTSSWIQVSFAEGLIVGRYKISCYGTPMTSDGSQMPKSWTFEGSNDGVNWTVLDTRSNEINWSHLESRMYSCVNASRYSNYRINVLSNNGSSRIAIGEIELFQAKVLAIPPSWKTFSTTLPPLDTFISDGMNDLAAFDRKSTKITTLMDDNTSSGEVLGQGRMYKERIDLKKYFDITGINVK